MPEQAAVVELVFERRAAGDSYRSIVAMLNHRGALTATGGLWQVSTLRGMVRNRFYTGRVEFDGEYIRARHDAIVSDLLFERANAHHQTNHTATHVTD